MAPFWAASALTRSPKGEISFQEIVEKLEFIKDDEFNIEKLVQLFFILRMEENELLKKFSNLNIYKVGNFLCIEINIEKNDLPLFQNENKKL